MSDLILLMQWMAPLVVFVGMGALQWRLIGALDAALARSQAPAQAKPPSINVPDLRAKPASPAPARQLLPPAAAKLSGPFAHAPPWFQAALHEIGFQESGNNRGIGRYIAMAHCGREGDPWCAIFANAMLESCGIPGTRSASSQSYLADANFIRLAAPALGAIVVYWRIARNSGQGHVGFYRGEDVSRVWTLGGNENDRVQIEALPKDSAGFGLIGYWWPKSVPLPSTGPVMMPAGAPAHVTTSPVGATVAASSAPAHQTNLIATVFGGQPSAYGGTIDDGSPGVALPFHFPPPRPRVQVTNAGNGKSVACDIVDVGPWNSNDPYWQTGSRPQAESGTDMSGRRTNGAGIDLTAAAATAIGIDGKGLVHFDFIVSPQQHEGDQP